MNEERFIEAFTRDEIESNFLCHERLFHYTTLDTLELILKNKTLRFNRNDFLNDLIEHKRAKNSCDYFVSCFTYELKESIPMWYIYSRFNMLNEDKEKPVGVRISVLNRPFFKNIFSFYNMKSESTDYFNYEKRGSRVDGIIYNNVFHVENGVMQLSKINFSDVHYNDRNLKTDPSETQDYGNLKIKITNVYSLASVKSLSWAYEKESRFFITLYNNKLNVKYIDVHLNDNFFNDMEITFSPLISDNEIKNAEERIKYLLSDYRIKFIESELKGNVRF